MVALKEWFEANRPKPKFEFSTRVFGKHNKVPFIGTTGADNLRSIEDGPQVTVLLDLPMKTKDGYVSVIRVPYSSIKSILREL